MCTLPSGAEPVPTAAVQPPSGTSALEAKIDCQQPSESKSTTMPYLNGPCTEQVSDAPPGSIKIWLMHDDSPCPIEITASHDATPGQITQAEANLGTLIQPIFPRSWVEAPLPLYENLKTKQVVKLHQHATTIKCPCVSPTSLPPKMDFPCQRIQSLWQQGPWVADDEMDFYLTAAELTGNNSVFPPAVYHTEASAEEEAGAWLFHPIRNAVEGNTFVSAAIVHHHWVPLVISNTDTAVTMTTTPEGSCFIRAATEIANDMNKTLEVSQRILPQSFGADCGFQAFAWIIAVTTGHQPAATPPSQAEGWRHIFAQHLRTDRHQDIIANLALGGTKVDMDLAQKLKTLLTDHGVWTDRAGERAQQLMEKIPHANLRNICSSKKPWADLKHAANQVKPPMKLIMQDELEAQIAARTQHRSQFGRKPAKTPFRPNDQAKVPPSVTAVELEVPPGVFKQQDGALLGPLRADQVQPNAEGVVLVDQSEAPAVLKLPTPVTQKGLAVLVLATKENSHLHEGDPIRFPAMCKQTQEPIIASGYLYQLGTQAVQRNEPAVKLAVDESNTECIRCVVYQDQSGSLWDSMQGHPVKSVFNQEPLLQPEGNADSPVIDVWDRQWVTKRHEKVKAKSADMFVFSFRMIADKASDLIAKSGAAGIYYEPRSSCGRYPSNCHHVTWLPNLSFQEAKYAQQTSPQATTLARNANRYGLRSDALNAQEIHTKHRPDTPLLLGQNKMIYTLGPLPYNTTKAAVSKLLKAWQWEARPLQPRGRSQDGNGIQWTIQATSDPSHWIYVLQHGDVLISKVHEDKPVETAPPYSIVASKRTLQHLQQTGEIDPWLANDPWNPKSNAKPSTQVNAALPAVSANAMASMEVNVERRVMAALTPKLAHMNADAPMETDAFENRPSSPGTAAWALASPPSRPGVQDGPTGSHCPASPDIPSRS